MNRPLPLVLAASIGAALLALRAQQPGDHGYAEKAEYHFLRVEYRDLPGTRRWGYGRGWWMQDWPEADAHFAQGVRRLTRVDIGANRHVPLTDDRLFTYPFAYATQVGYWDLSDAETHRLGDYLRRGGFLVVDDFYGERDWAVFEQSMRRVLPGHAIEDLGPDAAVLRVLYEIRERTFIPGLRHLRRGAGGGGIYVQQQAGPPRWRAMYDARGRMVVAIHFNQDVGDAWEHADLPEYPAEMTGLAYRFGINYIIYSMTH